VKASVKPSCLLNYEEAGRTLIFDLDNTIYDEIQFLLYAYQSVSKKYIGSRKKKVFKFLLETLEGVGRTNIFNKMLKNFPNEDLCVEDCLKIMREPIPDGILKINDWFSKYCQKTSNSQLLIITNGNALQQKHKVASLNLDIFFKYVHVIYADNYAPKPDPLSYIALSKKYKLHNPIYIGDHSTDYEFAKNCRIDFIDSKMIF